MHCEIHEFLYPSSFVLGLNTLLGYKYLHRPTTNILYFKRNCSEILKINFTQFPVATVCSREDPSFAEKYMHFYGNCDNRWEKKNQNLLKLYAPICSFFIGIDQIFMNFPYCFKLHIYASFLNICFNMCQLGGNCVQ